MRLLRSWLWNQAIYIIYTPGEQVHTNRNIFTWGDINLQAASPGRAEEGQLLQYVDVDHVLAQQRIS